MTTQWNNSSALLSVAAISALALSSCASDELDADDAEQPTATVTETVEAEPTEEPAEDPTDGVAEDAEPTEGATGSPEAGPVETDDPQSDDSATEGDDPLYQAVDAVEQEYPDAVVLDLDTEGSHYEFTIFDDGSEREFDVDRESFEISNTEEDDVDSDDQRKAEAVEIEFTDALRAAAEEGDGAPEQAELGEDDGTVVWEIELDSDTEVYVDVATGEVANVDS